ncbi:MAG TPA: hypothetical protein VG013_42030 [Gemmataceae bacterium]|nr:hypothetical protein [Gemmataceae bacterium]
MASSTGAVVSRISVETSTPDVTAPVRHRRGRRWLGLSIGLATLVFLAAAGGFLFGGSRGKADRGPTVYALLHVAKYPENVLEDKQHKHRMSDSDFDSYRQTQVMLLKSRAVLSAALRNPKVAELGLIQAQKDPVEWLEDNLQVDFQLAPEFMRIGMNGAKTDDLKVLVDAITDTYLAEVVHKEDNKRMARLTRLQELDSKFEEILRTKQETLNNLTKSFSGSTNPRVNAVKHDLALQSLNQAKTELLHHQSTLRGLNVEYGVLKAKQKDDVPVPDSAVEEALRKDPVVTALTARIMEQEWLTEDSDHMPTIGGSGSGERRREHVVKAAKAKLALRRQKLRPEIVKELRARHQQAIQAQLRELESRIELVKANEKVVDALVVQLATETKEISNKSVDVEGYKEEIESAQHMTKQLSRQIEALKMELLAPARVEKLQDAVVRKSR